MNVTERGGTNADSPDAGFRTVFGFYLGFAATCLVAGVGLLVAPILEVPRLAALGVGPTVFTVVSAVALSLGGRIDALPERLGRNRRRQALPFVPALVLVLALFLATTVPPLLPPEFGIEAVVTGQTVAAVAGLTAVIVAPAVGIATMARTRYVAAVTDDEPATTCTWIDLGWGSIRRQIVLSSAIALAVFSPILGWASVPIGGLALGLSLFVVYFESTRWTFSTIFGDPVSELRVHDAGVIIANERSVRFVPWTSILDARLTDDELILERHLFDLRCERGAIDDPGVVLEAIEETRGRLGSSAVDGGK